MRDRGGQVCVWGGSMHAFEADERDLHACMQVLARAREHAPADGERRVGDMSASCPAPNPDGPLVERVLGSGQYSTTSALCASFANSCARRKRDSS